MTVVAIIPARSGSRSVKNKNVMPLVGKPLLAYSIAAAKLASKIDEVIVSTDSKKYAKIALDYGAELPKRPTSISNDFSLHHVSRNYFIRVARTSCI